MTHGSRFITIEGGEGVGKSYLIEGLKTRLEKMGIPLLITREPGGTPLAQAVRELFLHPPEQDIPTAEAATFLVSAARSQHISQRIKPALASGRWVICDRFYDSTRVYQGVLGGVSPDFLENLVSYSVAGCHPELTFLLDCPVDLALNRIQRRASAEGRPAENRYDGGARSMHELLRSAYRDLATRFPDRIVLLDASKKPDQVLNDAWSQLERRFSL